MGSWVVLHPSGLPHAETFGVSPWVQWGMIGVIVAIGAWLALDTRGTEGRPDGGTAGNEEEGEALVVGRRERPPSPREERPSPRPSGTPLPPGRGDESAPDVREDSPSPRKERGSGGEALNPIRVLTAILGIGAGVVALDRARAIMAVAAVITTDGSVNISRVAVGMVVLLCVGGALAMPAPRLAAVAFVAAGGVGGFLATAADWESRLRWWGAGYVATAWDDLWGWTVLAFGLAVLALAGWVYKPRHHGLTIAVRRTVLKGQDRLG